MTSPAALFQTMSIPAGQLRGFSDRERDRWQLLAELSQSLAESNDVDCVIAADMGHALQREQSRAAVESSRSRLRAAAHDLRDPLATILLVLSDALEFPSAGTSQSGSSSDRVDRNLRIARRAAERMLGVVDEVMQEEEVLSTNRTRSVAPVEIAPFVRSLVDEYLVRASKAGIALSLSIAPSLPSVTLNMDALGRAVGNLVGNAIKFTARGGFICVNVTLEAGTLVFAVSDTGCGIAESDITHIYEPHWRAGNDTPGSGLGLGIAKEKVEEAGGTIRCSSHLGQGTTFRIEIPLAL